MVYVGHTGTGFDERELARLMKLLKPLEINECPFGERLKTNQPPHWVRPTLVAQIKFTEWTADHKLRHPVYLGLRDDKKPEEIVREPVVRFHAATSSRLTASAKAPAAKTADPPSEGARAVRLKPNAGHEKVIENLRGLEDARRDGVLALPDGTSVKVSNLHKIFWPKQKLTKGDLIAPRRFRRECESGQWRWPRSASK